MRSILALVLTLLALPAIATEEVIEVAGVAIRKGMTKEEVRSAYPEEAIRVVDKDPGFTDDFDIWIIRRDSWLEGGEIQFEDGVVRKASKNRSGTASVDAYKQFQLLNEMLVHLTGGKDVCAQISTSVTQDIPPMRDTYIILPDRIVQLRSSSRGEGLQDVSIRESLRVNPVPTTEPVRKEPGAAGQCVLVTDN